MDLNTSIKDYLARKDNDLEAHVPDSYRLTAQEKKQNLFMAQLKSSYGIKHSAACIQPCFKNYDSPVVSQAEADCMTNCTAKAMETLAHFQLNQAL